MDAREDHLRAGRADVDADARQRDVVLDPERIFLERPVGFEIVMIVVERAVVPMRHLLTVEMIGKAVRFRFGRIFGVDLAALSCPAFRRAPDVIDIAGSIALCRRSGNPRVSAAGQVRYSAKAYFEG